MRIWDAAGGRKLRDYKADNAVWVGWSAEGEPWAVGLEKGALRLHELTSGKSRRFTCEGLKPVVAIYSTFL